MSEKAIDKLLKRRKVGGILMERGLITPEQLEHALVLQRQSEPRQLLGEIILDFVESAKITGIRFRDMGLTEAGRSNEWFEVVVNAQLEYDSFRTV